jgi:hypothetical protein
MNKKLSKNLSLLCLASFLSITGCTTNYPTTVGTLGGAAAGAGVGAIVARNSASISNVQGIGYGALIGIPVGIGIAHLSDATAKYYIISTNDDAIRENQQIISDNQRYIEEERLQALFERPRGNPDPDNAEYIYVGPTMGNVWR